MILRAEQVVAGYARTTVLRGVSTAIAPGEVTGIIGPNGCGKSTLLRVLGRLLQPSDGRVWLDERPLIQFGARELARAVALLPQNPITPPGTTVGELVALGRHPHRRPFRPQSPTDREAVDQAIRHADVEHIRERAVSELSGGERQRAWIAMTLAQQPRVLLLDEPTAALDVGHSLDVLELVARLAREQGLTVAVVIHDLNLAAASCTRLLALRDGQVLGDGATSEVLTPELAHELFRVEAAITPDPRTGAPACRFYRAGACAQVTIEKSPIGSSDGD